MAKRPSKKGTHKGKEPKEFDEEVIQIDRVTRVVKGGRKLRFRATVVIGNRKSKVGIGVGKSHEVTGAIQKAISKAKKNLITVVMDESTIPHDIKIKYKSAKIIFLPAGPGTGIIAGGAMRKVLELAGIKDILSKSYGTTNKINTTRATYEALKMLRETPIMARKKAKKQSSEQKAEKKDNDKQNRKVDKRQSTNEDRTQGSKVEKQQKTQPEKAKTESKKAETKADKVTTTEKKEEVTK